MEKTMNDRLDKAIEEQIAYFKTLFTWVHIGNDALFKGDIEKHDRAYRMVTAIEDAETLVGRPFKKLVSSIMDEISEEDEDEYERIIQIVGSEEELEQEIVKEGRKGAWL